ncbi:sensor histidine kinase [Leptospira noumeaensis]|uniref:Sensor histidine kinase n=1 Tax=Leptospira noumeaensis TaxID=2484964 RepID=A0A4V3JJ92_9LEPT|nr:ATP-binding protein [Leptospira noumeaensis]TGK79180.1 sensor histidine kinase [Leptospira noumeaensis]
MDSFLSALPIGNYAVFSNQLKLKLVKGAEFDEAKIGEFHDDLSSDHFLSSSSLAKFNISHTHFLQAVKGETYTSEILIENTIHCFGISSISIPQNLISDTFDNSEQFILFSWVQKNQRDINYSNLEDISEKQVRVVSYEESLFQEIKDIFDWKKEIGKKGKHKSWMLKALPNLNTSLMQGTGLGGLVTSMGAMIRKVEKKGKVVTIPIRNFELVEENFKFTKKLVNSLAVAQRYFEESDFELKLLNVQDVIQLVQNVADDLDDMLAIKKQNILISVLPNASSYYVNLNKDRLITLTKELFINAMKYSPDGVSLIVLFLITEKKFLIKFINPSSEEGIAAVDFGHSDDLAFFHPFFRLNKVVDERYDKEEFALGLGLAIVKKIIEDMGGNIHIGTIQSGIYTNVLHSEHAEGDFAEVCITLEFDLE